MVIDRIDPELCNGCGLCVNICPTDVLRMDKKSEKAVITYPDDCMLCEFCVADCPTNAITLAPEIILPMITSWG